MRIAVCPGSFDPITVGHLDMVERAAKIFDEVIVCVSVNAEKRHMFTAEERLAIADAAISHIPNARAEASDMLLVDFARERGACALIKGARGCTDFDWEYQLAQINRDLAPELDTVIFPAYPEHQHVSSTMVREMIRYDRKLENYLPAAAAAVLREIREGKET